MHFDITLNQFTMIENLTIDKRPDKGLVRMGYNDEFGMHIAVKKCQKGQVTLHLDSAVASPMLGIIDRNAMTPYLKTGEVFSYLQR